jgi:aminoglycoside phosphotransferase (APT) family kinase protein
MIVDREQFVTLLACAIPGAHLIDAVQLGTRTFALQTRERRMVLRLGAPADLWAGDPLLAEAAALQALRGEIDLPLPELLHQQHEGAMPFVLLSYLEGQPIDTVAADLDPEERYAIGQGLGKLLLRAHAYSASRYGAFGTTNLPALSRVSVASTAPRPSIGWGGDQLPSLADSSDYGDRSYLAERLLAALNDATTSGQLNADGRNLIAHWVAENFASSGQPACLVHGDLTPERVLVRRRERQWQFAGLTGWGAALAWRPAWDHAVLGGAFAEDHYFDLRVGYGNAYDDATERRYDQLRDFALLPYRLVLYLEAGRADLALGLVCAPEGDL